MCSFVDKRGRNHFEGLKQTAWRHNRTLYYHDCCNGELFCEFGLQYEQKPNRVWITKKPKFATRINNTVEEVASLICTHDGCERPFLTKRKLQLHCYQDHSKDCDIEKCFSCKKQKRYRRNSDTPDAKTEEDSKKPNVEDSFLKLIGDLIPVQKAESIESDLSNKILIEVKDGKIYYQNASTTFEMLTGDSLVRFCNVALQNE